MADPHVLDFYDRHPISADQILAKLAETRGALAAVAASDLYPFDQDHYGGLEANAALAARAGLAPGAVVLDMCAGLGGPARWLASERGCRVVGLELNGGRAAGAARLNRLVGLEGAVSFVRGDVVRVPFRAGTFDAVWSQEAFLHVADKPALLACARRVLRPSGRLAFTDWLAGPGLSDDDRETMWRGIAARTIVPQERYLVALREAGFVRVAFEDVSPQWIPILQERLSMYRGLRDDARRGTPGQDPHAGYVAFYERFVSLVECGALGGGRFVAEAPAS